MRQELELQEREYKSITIIEELDAINKDMAKMRVKKEQLESDLISIIGHKCEGTRTYEIYDKKVTLKTDMIYSLNKKAYTSGEFNLPSQYNPIVEKVTFEVNKKLFQEYEKSAPEQIRDTLQLLVTKKDSKPNVVIGARV